MMVLRLIAVIGMVGLAGCWGNHLKPDTAAEEWRRDGRVIALSPGEDACTARVGQAVEFPFSYKVLPSELIQTLGVRIDGKRVKKPALRHASGEHDPAVVGYADIVYIFRAEKAGVYQVEVTPYYLEKGPGKPWECVVMVKD
jgi:hypothetical protein